MNKSKRQEVYDKCNGHCAYCGQPITVKEMQVDHMHPKRNGGTDDLDNLAPSCRQCNHYKRAQTVPQFRITMQTLHQRVGSIYIHKVAANFGMATLKPWDGRFYFERAIPTGQRVYRTAIADPETCEHRFRERGQCEDYGEGGFEYE